MRAHLALITLIAVATTLSAQQPPRTNTSTLDANGTAHITRVVPVPTTISSEAQASLRRPAGAENRTLAERRTSTDAWQTRAGETSRKAYPVKIESLTIANVPVRNVLPLEDTHPDHVLINVHGGGFNSDSGSFTESIPIANLTHTRVVAVLYRLAPEHPFPAAIDDTIAVYRDLLKTYKPAHIALYGTSAGAILTAEVAVRLKQLNLPLPAALGIFSGMGDFSQNGDSLSLYALRGLTGSLSVAGTEPRSTEYTGTTDPKYPVLSPLYADLHGMPPTLFITSGRDILLSGTGILHRAFLRSGDDARLIVFEALPHAFWNDISLPETKEAYGYMADFFSQQLNR
ncbi:alpha/beta hydrolase fold domain-containing protein [Tunturibacter empetritectus]|uniref:Alpha/beta hydrolase fold domain-containing protein n=1 Tax=Tunturiibacter empetritectus TaxID=3069691 RepID=A0AAU7ZCH0_9BACT